ncbi:MAG: hypothetical protein CMM50_00685 [Rhodospirillaceae bacterium]|nr:hypothetical protein [Rhodospirillaceae bacterium]|tara:strand:- start:2331 stop:2609 length:279 start_codon:yes stop_codon:yes gene_type:complete
MTTARVSAGKGYLSMDTWKYFALVAVTTFAVYTVLQAGNVAESEVNGPYRIAAQGNGTSVWEVNTETGAVRLCLVPGSWPGPADCGPWSSAP